MEASVRRNKTKEYYYKLCRIFYMLGAPNYWYGDLGIPKYVATIHDILVWIVDLIIYVYFASMLAANFTQHNLSEKQKNDMIMFSISQPCWHVFSIILKYYKKDVRIVCYDLVVKLKEKHNDIEAEKQLMQSIKFYGGIFMLFIGSALIMYGVQGLMDVVCHGKNFVTMIPAWPDINDTSTVGSIVRVYHYVGWWLFIIRGTASAFLMVIMVTVCLSHQYKNLCSYFRSLNTIFEEKELTQEEKEHKYVQAFKLGIEYHNITLRCKNTVEKIFYMVFSIQIVINFVTVTLLLLQLVNLQKTPTNLLTVSVTIVCALLSTGCLWCSAGDVTIEASQLSTAMFESGWQHCRGHATLRARTLLVVAMWHSQRPVQIRCLGVIELSYSSYVKIGRLSYQVFSVLYSR